MRAPPAPAGPVVIEGEGTVTIAFRGALDTASTGPLWRPTLRAAAAAGGRTLVLDLAALTHCDTTGAALLLAAEGARGGPTRIEGASAAIEALLARVRAATAPEAAVAGRPADVEPALSRTMSTRLLGGLIEGFAFVGEALLALLGLRAHRRMIRLADLARFADQAGVQGLPLALLLGALLGLILAFQSAIPMRRFGADIFVADLVSIALLRELGPLIAAVILAGRTGSAEAAEIGTMKVNEELDAMVVMGLHPMTLLVLPRVATAMLAMPALVIALDLAGLVGMTAVMGTFGYPPALVLSRVIFAVRPGDLIGGIFRGIWFGALVAAIGCRAGLATGVGPRAVGIAATRAVVGGIVGTIVLDGVFAVLTYRLGL
jgi:phospholipid/cholesterol/gamma-HCH transport system permease protein